MNPVLRKDLLAMLRLRRIAAIQVVFVAALAGIVLANWPQGGVLSLATAGQDQLLMGLILGQMVLLILFVPGIAATALTGEKEQNTLEMLYASRLRPSQIISGKILSAISFPVLLLISGLPFLALLNWRGAVDVNKLAMAYAILLIAGLLLAIVSLMISALCKQSATALVFAYVTVLVVCGGTLVPAAIMLRGQEGLPAQILHYTRSLSPVAAALSLLRPELGELGGRVGAIAPTIDDLGTVARSVVLLPAWKVFVPLAAVVIAGCFAVVVSVLRRPPLSVEAFGAPIGGLEDHRSIGRRVMYLIDPKKKRKPFGSFNPLINKEARTNALRSGRWGIRIFYGSLFLSLALAVMSLYGSAEYQHLLAYVATVLVAFQIGVIGLVAPSLTSSAVSGEIENGTFEMLRMTPLGGGEIFWGKFIPAFLPAVLPVIALLPAYLAVCYIDTSYVMRLVQLLPVVVMAVAFCCTLGLCCSSFVNNTARATVSAYVIAGALFVLPMFAWWAGGEQLDIRTAAALASPSPLVMGMNLVAHGDTTTGMTLPIQSHYATHLWIMGGLCVLMLLMSRFRLTQLMRQG